MKLIAVDTATKYVSCAALENGVLAGERLQLFENNHSVILMPLLDNLLELCGWQPEQVDVWAAVTGPGSFTGVRIGVSTVRALAHGQNKKVVGVNTLETMAAGQGVCDRPIAVMLDARRDQIYGACYCLEDGMPKEILAPVACSYDELVGRLPDEDCLFMGDGALAHFENIRHIRPGSLLASANLMMPTAAAAAILAEKLAENGQAVPYGRLVPMYVRQPQAVRTLEERRRMKEEAAREN